MSFDEGTVFVLGAGFTRAMLPGAPLLVDDYGIEALQVKFDAFPDARDVLKLEVREDGKIDIERLMTRLAGKMPYDVDRSEKLFDILLSEVKHVFMERLAAAKKGGPDRPTLNAFALHCLKHQVSCITFNYDDVLDESLWHCAHEPGHRGPSPVPCPDNS